MGGLAGEVFNGEVGDPPRENTDTEENLMADVVCVEVKGPPELLESSVHIGASGEVKPNLGEFVEAESRNTVISGNGVGGGVENSVIPDAQDDEAEDLKPVDYARSDQNPEMVSASLSKTLNLQPIVSEKAVSVPEDGEVLEGRSVSVKNIADKLYGVNANRAEFRQGPIGLGLKSNDPNDSKTRVSEREDFDEEGDGKVLLDPATLAALVRAFGASPTSLGSSRLAHYPPRNQTVVGQHKHDRIEEWKKFDAIRAKYLRIVQKLQHSPKDKVPAQLLNHLDRIEELRHGRQIARASGTDEQFEAFGDEDLNFSCNILVLGKSGVGKSATINSIFGEEKCYTNAFEPATASVEEISGIVDGVSIRVIDTPGLRVPAKDQATNRKILSSVKKYTKRCPPDVVLYVDRLNTQTQDSIDLPLLSSISSSLGSSLWFNAVIAFTHAGSAPPDGPDGNPLNYEAYEDRRYGIVQHSIRLAADDMRVTNRVALVENHPLCRIDVEGQRVLPNGVRWRSELLLLVYSSKIIAEVRSVLKLQDSSPENLFGFQYRPSVFPTFMPSLLQSREHLKLSNVDGGEVIDSDMNLDDLSDIDQEDGEEEEEYEQLPPFKPLKRSQIAKLTKEQTRAYFDEYDYRIKLFQKIQLKEDLRRLKEMEKRGKRDGDDPAFGASESGPYPLPDLSLPPSFDSDNPVHHFRTLDPISQLLIRPLMDAQVWDHDYGVSGVSVEKSHAIAGLFPAGVSARLIKDKDKFYIHLDSSILVKHGEIASTLAGLDIQSVEKDVAYILRCETKFKNLKRNKTAFGILLASFRKALVSGLKIEDRIMIGKRVSLASKAGVFREQGEMVYQANLEACLREKDYPIGQSLAIWE